MVTGKTFIYSLVILLFILSLAMVGLPLGGTVEAAPITYYVNAATGNDGNTPAQAQNPATPWKTITHAVGAVATGDTIIVAPGTYNAALGESFPIVISMSLTIQSSGGAAATTISSGGNDAVYLALDDGEWVTFTGFTVTGGGAPIYVYDTDGDSDLENNNVTITNNIVRDNTANGIQFSNQITGSSVINVSGNQLLSNKGEDNLYFSGRVTGNAVVNVTNNTITDSRSDGIEFCSPFDGNSRTTVSGNTISDSDETGIYICEGIQGSAVVTVTNNSISDSDDYGIYVAEVVENGQINIDGNTITESDMSGITFYYEDTISGNARVTINGNTIRDSGEYGGIYIEAAIWDNSIVTITNNTISNSDGYGIVFESDINDDSIITVANNMISDSGWDGIEFCEEFYNRSRGTIGGNTITNSGEFGLEFEEEIEDNSVVTVTGNTITQSCSHGLYFDEIRDNSQVTVDGNNISNNGGPCALVVPLLTAHIEGIGGNDAEEAARAATNNEDEDDDEARVAAMNAATNGVDLHDGIYVDDVEDDSTLVISRNTISGNARHGVVIDTMAKANQVTVSPCNLIFGNPDFGLLNESGLMINGELNWWGAVNGPSGEGPGSGDKVSTDVDFEPWAIADDCSISREQLPSGPGVSPTMPGWQRQLKPANLSTQILSVNPQQTFAGQPVTITTNVVNIGDEAGNLNIALKINGQVQETRMVSV
ncbi:MAG: right-handed parallel beta-helix repeat-containing protein, partial [Chloroflexota bacterium]